VKRVSVRLLAAITVVALARSAGAQATGSVAARADVVTVGMTVTVLRDLNFGTVLRGVATAVQPTAATAGAWQVTGNSNSFAVITFTLPTVLTNIQALPGSTMPITFAANAARWRRANNNPAGGNAFNPAVGAVGRFGPPVNPTLYVWIGGSVNPAAAAKPGIYRGTVIVTLVYL
jgi:hypothetical protein